jgi:hypothetical protein
MVRFPGDSDSASLWRQFTVPWAPDERVEKLRDQADAAAVVFRIAGPNTFPRTHGSPFYATKIPDLNPLHHSRYMDATGTHRLRSPEDVARYAAFVMGTDPMEFGSYKILTSAHRLPLCRRGFVRHWFLPDVARPSCESQSGSR